jgi:Domain of unknown function (DUF4158)
MVLAVPVEFLSDLEAAAFGRYGGSVRQADLERFFFLDDGDRLLVAGQRGDHNRLGFSLQLATVRYIGKFLADPLEGVPSEVIDFLAGQLQIADPSCVKRYAVRAQTHREHAGYRSWNGGGRGWRGRRARRWSRRCTAWQRSSGRACRGSRSMRR